MVELSLKLLLIGDQSTIIWAMESVGHSILEMDISPIERV